MRTVAAFVLVAAVVGSVLITSASPALALQSDDVVINEIVAANDSYFDSFGETPDWIELQNNGASTVDLEGWSIADDGGPWTFPAVLLGPGERLIVHASGRDVTSPELHTDFALKRGGETVTLADANGLLVDAVTYPALDDDMAYGRGSGGGLGVLVSATPGALNSALAPSSVTITTPPQTFLTSLSVTMTATTQTGEQVRYTTDSTPVTVSSPAYNEPIVITTSTVVRAAVVGNGAVGPETSAGYIAVSSSIADFSSDIPLVIVHSTGVVGTDTQDAIVSVIERGANGRAGIFDPADYTGFAGLRIRGATSAEFPKKQYKFELWGDRLGDEVDADLLGLGSDSDWGLYAPGFYDRAMINNPFVYEIGQRLGVLAPGYRFVELFIEDNPSQTVGDGDYRGLYVLRETIKIGEERVDITEHTSSSAGPDGGYILRYDWEDECCATIAPTRFDSVVAVDRPKRTNITPGQLSYITGWWADLVVAATTSFAAIDAYIDFDSFIDHWLLQILAMDVDLLRASNYMYLDVGGQLQGGPLWDFDRALGGADDRNNELFEAQSWAPNGPGGHSYLSDVYSDLWTMPEVQARLRARWAELRAAGGVLSDGELETLIFAMGAEITEAYGREDIEWGSTSGYGSRFGGLDGELDHMRDWVLTRTAWLDDQFAANAPPPTVTVPVGGIEIQAGAAVEYQVQASDPLTMVFAAAGLPEGLDMDPAAGVISGTAAYGDTYGEFLAQIRVTNSGGAQTTVELRITDPSTVGQLSSVVLNEYNGVAPGLFLDQNDYDIYFGTVSGNGGDWFEIVTIDDRLDLRGWRFDLWSNNELGEVVQGASLVLGDDELLHGLRAGTIITVAESVADDLSYDPTNDDWTINLQSNDAGAGGLWVQQSSFDTNHKRWRLVIRDDSGAIMGYVGGETAAFETATGQNLSSTQVLALDDDPAAGARSYRATSRSTFGQANVLGVGVSQDFSSIRPELAMLGDGTCDGTIDIVDALFVAQYSVGTRTDGGECPLADPTTQINLDAADVNEDGTVTITDALFIAQCSVGLTNVFCPG